MIHRFFSKNGWLYCVICIFLIICLWNYPLRYTFSHAWIFFIFFSPESCDKVQCTGRKTCLLDQVLRPHCVRCQGYCSSNSFGDYVCGADNVTYSSTCHIRQAACMKGKAVPQAYRGKCKGNFFRNKASLYHLHFFLK